MVEINGKELELIFVYPKNPNVLELVRENKKRYLALDRIKGIKGFCKWCLVTIENKKRKYCSINCKKSAWAFFYPQKHSQPYLMARQKGLCADCGYDFKERTKKIKMNDFLYDDMGDVDHIIPISQGGQILGLENIQLLCRECHLFKSSKERVGKSFKVSII